MEFLGVYYTSFVTGGDSRGGFDAYVLREHDFLRFDAHTAAEISVIDRQSAI